MASVLVHIDLDGAAGERYVHPSSLAALTAGRALASAWGATLYAAVIVESAAAAATGGAICAEIGRAGADRLVVATTMHPTAPLWALLGEAWQSVLDQVRPRVVLFGADAPATAELAPRTGARLGARLLQRARVSTGDQLELRDRDGGFVRASEGGAAVALVAAGVTNADGAERIEITVLAAARPADVRIELVGSEPAGAAAAPGLVIGIGSDVVGDAATRAAAFELGLRLGARVIEAGAADATTDATTDATADVTADVSADGSADGSADELALAPEVYIAIGKLIGDLAGATSLVRIGVDPNDRRRGDAGTLPGPIATATAELAAALEGR